MLQCMGETVSQFGVAKIGDDGKWDKEKFAGVHILFLERTSEYDYMQRMFMEQLTKHCT